MAALRPEFEPAALGTDPALADVFARRGFAYTSYALAQGADPLGDLAALRQLARAFRALRPALVHTFDTKPGVWGRLAARLAGVPAVAGTLPGLGSLYSAGGARARLLRLAYEPLQALACRVSDTTVFQHEHDARELVRRRVVPAAKARVIHGSGVDTRAFAPGGEAATREEIGLPADERPVVVMVSRLLRSKGVLELAAAARSAPDLSFVLVGPAGEGLDALAPGELDEVRASLTWL